MAGNKDTLEDTAIRDDSQVDFVKSFVDFLRQHRAVLPTLPEMLERLISNETSETQNFDMSREDEQRVLTKRKKADLHRHYKSLQDEMAEKDERIKELAKNIQEKDAQIDAMKETTSFSKQERIMQLENELHEKTMELEKLSKDKEEEITRWKNYCTTIEKFKSSSDEYIKEAEVREEKLKELTDRITSLKSELKSKDQEMELIKANKEEQVRECTDRFNQLKEQYERALSRKEEGLNQLNLRHEDQIQEMCTKHEQLKQYLAGCTQLKEKYEALLGDREKELILVTTSNNELVQEIRAKDEQVKEYIARCAQLKEKCNALLADKEKELNLVTTSNYELGQEIRAKHEQAKEYIAGCKQLKFILANKEEELKGMKTRLAYLSEKQVKKDQRKVEDTAASNRPSDVEKDFAAFLDEDRIDAFDKMQELYGSEEEIDVSISYPRLACIIFEAAYEQTKETKEAVLDLFKVITKTMIDLAPKMGQKYSSCAKKSRFPCDIPFSATAYNPELEYPIDVLDALVLSMKETAHKCNLESLEQDVKEKIKEKWLSWFTKDKSCHFSFSNSLLRKLGDYIKACIRLTWRMVTQVPPMQLEYQSSTLKDIHKNLGYHSSPEMCSRHPTAEGQASDEGLEIACYLWPGLLDGGGKLIRAGEVVCKVKVENTVI